MKNNIFKYTLLFLIIIVLLFFVSTDFSSKKPFTDDELLDITLTLDEIRGSYGGFNGIEDSLSTLYCYFEDPSIEISFDDAREAINNLKRIIDDNTILLDNLADLLE